MKVDNRKTEVLADAQLAAPPHALDAADQDAAAADAVLMPKEVRERDLRSSVLHGYSSAETLVLYNF